VLAISRSLLSVAAAVLPVSEKALALAQSYLSAYGDWAIVGLSAAVAVYHPIGPDLLIVLVGLAGGHVFRSAGLAALFTLLGSLAGYFLARGLGARLVPLIFRRRMEAFERFRRVFARYGVWLVVLSAFGPVPLTYACWLAGLSRLRVRTFILAVVAGMLPRFFGEAAAVTVWGERVRELLGGISGGTLPP
jgi:membrane protein YqaA with SNARE-associated domain